MKPLFSNSKRLVTNCILRVHHNCFNYCQIVIVNILCCVLQYVVVKFLGARKASAERIGVLGVNFFGYEVKLNCPLNDDLHLVKFGTLTDYLSIL